MRKLLPHIWGEHESMRHGPLIYVRMGEFVPRWAGGALRDGGIGRRRIIEGPLAALKRSGAGSNPARAVTKIKGTRLRPVAADEREMELRSKEIRVVDQDFPRDRDSGSLSVGYTAGTKPVPVRRQFAQ